MSNPVIGSPSSFANMSRTELDLVAEAAQASGFNPYDIFYGSPSNRSSPPLGPRTSTPAGSGLSQDLSFEAQFSPSIQTTPSPTPRTGRQPASLLNLAREQVCAQGINPMKFMARPLREAGRRGEVGAIVVPPFTPPTPLPSFLPQEVRLVQEDVKVEEEEHRHLPRRTLRARGRAGGGRRAAGGGRRAAEEEMTIPILVLIAAHTEEVKDGKNCYGNFNDCDRII